MALARPSQPRPRLRTFDLHPAVQTRDPQHSALGTQNPYAGRPGTRSQAGSASVRTASAVAEERPLRQALHTLLLRADLLFLHVDLDVLDPSLVPSASTPSPDGWSVTEAAGVMRAVLDTGRVAAVGIAGLNPGAGQRGERSIETAIELIEGALPTWRAAATDVPLVDA